MVWVSYSGSSPGCGAFARAGVAVVVAAKVAVLILGHSMQEPLWGPIHRFCARLHFTRRLIFQVEKAGLQLPLAKQLRAVVQIQAGVQRLREGPTWQAQDFFFVFFEPKPRGSNKIPSPVSHVRLRAPGQSDGSYWSRSLHVS